MSEVELSSFVLSKIFLHKSLRNLHKLNEHASQYVSYTFSFFIIAEMKTFFLYKDDLNLYHNQNRPETFSKFIPVLQP